ncbi:hypothetical protein B0H10DRAFT_1961371 [Mycena sp. CBHHK59/15]|nr:hypothetical protein B0H10DRAFT_1961371 [Mycena sp. CBHHK59/15]
MAMPAPSKKKRNMPDAPRLTTRTQNKLTHPAVDAGVTGLHRTVAEMEKARATEAAQLANTKQKAATAIARVAAIEDAQRKKDQTYDETANHPPDPPAHEEPQPMDDEGPQGDHHLPSQSPDTDSDVDFDSDKEQDFAPSEHSSDEEEEEEPTPRGRGIKPAKSSRNDVSTARSTEDSSGTPAASADGRKCKISEKSPSNSKRSVLKKPKLAKKGGLAAVKKRAASSASGQSSVITAPNDEESMVQYGGPAVEDDANEQLEHPAPVGKANKKKGLPTNPGLKVVAAPPRPPTKKELRGDAKKWTLEHLPCGTTSLFTSDVVPLAREVLAGLEPWAKLSVANIQDVVTRAFPRAKDDPKPRPKYVVTEEGPWWGLLQYRSHNWRNGFLQQADKGMLLLHKTHQEEEDDEEEPEQDAPNSSEGTAVKPCVFKFDMPEARADFAEWALEPEASETGQTMAFHWNQWGDGKVKKGFFLSYLIVYAYSYHLMMLDSIPTQYKRSEERPYGALLLAVQAVECNLQRWRTGTYIVERGQPGEFSDDNWGDIKTRTSRTTQIKVTRRATKFLSALKKWDDARWDELWATAAEWVEKKRTRTTSSSHGTSDAEDMEEVEEEPEVIVLSD